MMSTPSFWVGQLPVSRPSFRVSPSCKDESQAKSAVDFLFDAKALSIAPPPRPIGEHHAAKARL